MKFKFLQLCLLIVCTYSCGDDEELGSNNENELFISSTSSEYNFSECGVMLAGSFQGLELLRSELGFVYSYEESNPTINDNKVEFSGPPDRTVFTALLTDYTFDRDLYWRSYVIYNDEVYYGFRMMFSEERPVTLSDFYSLSFDCARENKVLQIHRDIECPQWDYAYSICLRSRLGDEDCLEFEMSDDRTRELEIEEHIGGATIFLYAADNPEEKIYNDNLNFPKTSRVSNQKLSNTPFSAAESTGFQIGDYFYVCGGYTTSDEDYTKDLWRFEYATNEWIQLADFPGTARAFMISFVKDDIAYVGSGGTDDLSESDFYSYDPKTNEWTTLADLPIAGFAGVGFALEDYAYVTNLTGFRDPTVNNANDVYRYNFSTNVWTTMNTIKIRFNNSRNMAVSLNNKGYLISTSEESTSIYSYDENNDNWDLIDFFPLRCDDGVAVVANNSLFITSGRGMNSLYQLNLPSRISSTHCTVTPEFRSEAVAFVIDNKIVVSGGLEHNEDPTIFTKTLNTMYSLEIPQ